jgi:hypothetical protein
MLMIHTHEKIVDQCSKILSCCSVEQCIDLLVQQSKVLVVALKASQLSKKS